MYNSWCELKNVSFVSENVRRKMLLYIAYSIKLTYLRFFSNFLTNYNLKINRNTVYREIING